MRMVCQRVSQAKVEVNDRVVCTIEQGMLVYLGVGKCDTADDVKFIADKLVNLRIFADEAGTNCEIINTQSEIVTIHMFLTGDGNTANTVTFSAPTPSCWSGAVWLWDDINPSYLWLGTTHDPTAGLTVTFVGCKNLPIYLGSMSFDASGSELCFGLGFEGRCLGEIDVEKRRDGQGGDVVAGGDFAGLGQGVVEAGRPGDAELLGHGVVGRADQDHLGQVPQRIGRPVPHRDRRGRLGLLDAGCHGGDRPVGQGRGGRDRRRVRHAQVRRCVVPDSQGTEAHEAGGPLVLRPQP